MDTISIILVTHISAQVLVCTGLLGWAPWLHSHEPPYQASFWREPLIHVIEVYLKPTPTAEEAQGNGITSIKYQLTLAVAKKLGLLDQKYNRLKKMSDQLEYYTYGCEVYHHVLEHYMRSTIVPLVGKQLSGKNYLLVVHNLQWPIDPGSITRDCRLIPPLWTRSDWCISPTSQDAYNKSKSEEDGVLFIDKDEQVVLLTMVALHQSAEHIFNTFREESIEYWHVIALGCFHYAMVIFAKHSPVEVITSDELIHQWATLLPCMTRNSSSSRCSYMRRVGRVILEAFQKYSLLQLPFSPTDESHEANNTAAQFLVSHGLIRKGITVDELTENKKNWISFVGDHGLITEGITVEDETRGTTALVLRGCSQHTFIFSTLNYVLHDLRFLRVLDISYTPLESLPSSIGHLQNLRLLSLRGCHHLKTLFVSSTTRNTYSPLSTLYQLEILDLNGVPFSHLTQDVPKQKTNLIYFDMSYSNINTFPPNFFEDMSNLEELILMNCSNLVELPPSMVALSILTTLEITATQIKYFPQKIFEEMKRLQSLKLNENKKLVSLPESLSGAHGLINLHIEGYESKEEEFKFEGHPSLISFTFIRAPHVRHLSLRKCRKLECVEFKNLDALEDLDLSATSVKELSPDIPNATQLRRLLLLGVPSLLRFPWHMLERLPEEFYLDQCTEGNGNHSGQASQLCVRDRRFFYSFRESCVGLVRDGQFFQSFYVRVTPGSTNKEWLQHEGGMVDDKLQELVQNQSTYVAIHNSCYAEKIAVESPVTAPLRRTERHVEITGMQQTPSGLKGLLNVTKSISVTCDTSIGAFHSRSSFQELEECELRWCHKMNKIFDKRLDMKNLRNAHVCNLKNLVRFCADYSEFAFSSLVHLHLEYCPRLEAIMPDAVTLPSLKAVDILFCYNLKNFFYAGYYGRGGTYQLPSLQRVRLQELPLLQQFNDKDTNITIPMWKELHIRGCWSLRCLPRLQDQQEKVKVNGERSWWSKLQWGSPSHCDSYEPKLSPKFASFNERTKVTSYLR